VRLSLPGGNLASWLASWTNVPGIVVAVVFLVLLFPDGRMPSRRWWPLGLAGAVALVVPTIVLAVGTWPLRGPGLVTREDELPDLVDTVFWTTFLVSLVLGPSAWSRWCCGSAAPGRCSASRSSGSPTAPPRASPSACSPRRDPTGPTSSSWERPAAGRAGHRHLPVQALGHRPAGQPHPGLRPAHRPGRGHPGRGRPLPAGRRRVEQVVGTTMRPAAASLWLRPSAAGQVSFARDQAGLPGGHG